jgi:hypothetical protein
MLVGGRLGQVTPDARYLVFLVEEGGTTRLRYAPLLADGSVGAAQRMLKQSDPDIESFHLSPDGSTLVYSTPEADGRLNAFLTDFPAGARQVQATTIGAGSPRFSKDGTTIFYGSPAVPLGDPPRGALAKRPVALKSLSTSGPQVQVLVQGEEPPGVILNSFDVARDARLLMMRRTGGDKPPSPRLVLVQNWRSAVER